MTATELIARKRDGLSHSASEINELVAAIVDGSMADYQVAAWLMAAYLNGLDDNETLALTLAMRDSGARIDQSGIPPPRLDKHSSGGVGDKTTLVVVPLLAAAGVSVLKMSGRGLGFSGGTIDKLESIPGFRTELSVKEALQQVQKIGAALIGQTPDLVPADRKLYALRDVTATIDSIPLIAASIMSKKLAGGAETVILDVKVGGGAFMKSVDRARELAMAMVRIGERAGVRTLAALTSMDEPLGHMVGNAVEVIEACEILVGKDSGNARLRQLCVLLAAHGLVLAGKDATIAGATEQAESLLNSGKAADKLEEIIAAQGGDSRVVRSTERLAVSRVVNSVRADSAGFIAGIDAEAVGKLVVSLGGGRRKKDDAIDHSVGVALLAKNGDAVQRGDFLAHIYLRDESQSESAAELLRQAYRIAPKAPEPQPILYEIVSA